MAVEQSLCVEFLWLLIVEIERVSHDDADPICGSAAETINGHPDEEKLEDAGCLNVSACYRGQL